MLIQIRHLTRYLYQEPAAYSVQSLRLRPPSFVGQRVREWTLTTSAPAPGTQFTDGFGNLVELVAINQPHAELVIEASGLVETEDRSGVVAGVFNATPVRVYLKRTPQTMPDAAISELASAIKEKDTLPRMHALAEVIRDKVEYKTGMTDVHTSAAEALKEGHGVCQDHAHIFIAAARELGVPARYVTGYLVAEEEEPAQAHHAWAEVWIEGLGWVGFDVANSICPTDRYVRLSTGLDAATAAPIMGARRGGGEETLTVSVDAHEVKPDGQRQSQSQAQGTQSQTQG
ncbi:MAG: transglutaminase family protein [Hyphomicrobiaceae bacterium]|nr:transglutaminase family protein [Hyphomicrobiaceae bacterium]